jgi:hypothetical protein
MKKAVLKEEEGEGRKRRSLSALATDFLGSSQDVSGLGGVASLGYGGERARFTGVQVGKHGESS